MHLNSSSPALAPMPATEPTLTSPLLETLWGWHRFFWLTSTEATLCISDVCPFSQEWHFHPPVTGQRDCPRWNQIHAFAFAFWIFLLMLSVQSTVTFTQDAGKYPRFSSMLQWISCKPCTISSPGYFPITYTSHVMFCHFEVFVADISPCYNSHSCTYTYAIHCPFHDKWVTYKSLPFRLKFPRREQRPELILLLLLLLPFLLQGKYLFRYSFSLLKVRNSKPRLLGQGSCASQPSRQCCKDTAPRECGGIYPVPWDSHHTLWQRWNRAPFLHCFILHVHLASRSDVQHPGQQPHHCSTTFVTLTNELHTRNCSHMLSSGSISPHPCWKEKSI